jgi:hypothetical protein
LWRRFTETTQIVGGAIGTGLDHSELAVGCT